MLKLSGLALSASAAGCVESTDSSPSESTSSDAGTSSANAADGGSESLEAKYPNAYGVDPRTKIVVTTVEATVDRYSTEITGTAINESETDYDYVQFSFALYDDSNAKVGDALANTSGLASGGKWRFEAIGTSGGNVASYKLNDITAY